MRSWNIWRVQLTHAGLMGMMLIGATSFSTRAEELPEDLDLIPDLPAWIRQFTARTGAGYKDNVTLSSVAPEASPFLSLGLDGIFSRLPTGRTQLDIFFLFDHLQFFSSESVDKEQLGFAQSQVKYDLSDQWQVSLALEYLYQNQVLDVSTDLAGGALTTNVLGHSAVLRPGTRFELPGQFWMAAELPINRQFFAQPLDDYWETGPKLLLGKRYGHKSDVTLSYESLLRDYDTDPKTHADGSPIPDTSRAFYIQEVRLDWQHYWDTTRRWRTSLRLGYRVNRDNGGGYFDFDKPHGAFQLRYRPKTWEVSARVRLAYYDYAVQTAGIDNPDQRQRFETTYSLRGEKRLAKFVSLYAEYEHERIQSNDPIEEYTVNRVNAGLVWEF